jgi:hypothetical protein
MMTDSQYEKWLEGRLELLRHGRIAMFLAGLMATWSWYIGLTQHDAFLIIYAAVHTGLAAIVFILNSFNSKDTQECIHLREQYWEHNGKLRGKDDSTN